MRKLKEEEKRRLEKSLRQQRQRHQKLHESQQQEARGGSVGKILAMFSIPVAIIFFIVTGHMPNVYLSRVLILLIVGIPLGVIWLVNSIKRNSYRRSDKVTAEDEPKDAIKTIRCPKFGCKYEMKVQGGEDRNREQKIKCPRCGGSIILPLGTILLQEVNGDKEATGRP